MEQYLKVPQKGKAPERRGPYWLYTCKKKGKSAGHRLNPEEAKRYIQEIEASHLFQKLCDEYAEVTERLGELERQLEYDSPENKRRKSRSSKTLK